MRNCLPGSFLRPVLTGAAVLAGHPTLVTGGFYVAAPYDRMGRITIWETPAP